ncbi:hypothetical protein GSF04_21880 [Pseudoalteromonas sp. A22]|uniref:hypothetical protein n=1 Tax=Pseudoalteromonas TaxID=53246 RepID=UPI001BA8FEB3|nr:MULTISPECIES: hypothetical protein [Pseudoalteromonas]QUI64980.1 hypothetical protein GSF04_21880 [Pseudoalteromonas sp. A22]USE70681.1 hypothetical protein CTT31_16780 [Pseudoalteromonas flavipulchra]
MKKITNDAEYYAWFDEVSKKTAKFIYEQPGVLITLGYLTLNLAGFVYLTSLFNAFSIEIIKYMELSDLLMSFLAEPDILFATSCAIAVGGGVAYVVSKFDRKRAQIKELKGWKSWLLSHRILYRLNPFYSLVVVAMLIYPNAYAGLLGSWNAESIKEGNGKLYNFDLINSISLDQQKRRHFQDMQIILESERYVFLYEKSKNRSVILSRDNIASIQIVAQGVDN